MAQLSVPAVGHDTARWRVPDEAYVSKTKRRAGTGEYSAAVTPELAGITLDVPSDLAGLASEALVHAARFDGAVAQAWGRQAQLEVPLSAILLRTESVSSSTIERLTASAKQVALAELGQGAGSNAGLIVGNVRATEAAIALADGLDIAGILRVHRVLMEKDRLFPDEPGVLRKQLVWVGGSEVSPVGASHVAPEAARVPAALEDLVAFMRRDDVEPLVQIAVAHAQFETIHPFVDGNGRTGRALVQSMLRTAGVSSNLTLPLSAGLLRNTEAYFSGLNAYRGGDAGPIVESFAQAAIYGASTGLQLVADLVEALRAQESKLEGLRSHATARTLAPLLLGQPVVDVAGAARLLGGTEQAAARALGVLEERGVVTEMSGRRRGRVWQQREVLHVLDGFAESIRRR